MLRSPFLAERMVLDAPPEAPSVFRSTRGLRLAQGHTAVMEKEEFPFPMPDELKAEIREQLTAMGSDEDSIIETIRFLECNGGFMGSGWG